MLQAFSDRIRKSRWLGYTIVAFISVPFALWGIQAYFAGPGDQVAAEINGVEISARMLDQQVSERRQQLRQQYGQDLPESLTGSALREHVLQQMIDRELVALAASELALHASDSAVAARIRQQPYFQRDGRFDADLYRETLAFSGLQPADFEADMRRTERMAQLQSGLLGSIFALPGETAQLASLDRQEREITLLRLSLEQATERISLDDDEVRAYYEAEQDRFMTPEAVRVSYIVVDREELAADIELDEDRVVAEVESRQQEQADSGSREAAHILIEHGDDEAAAEELAWSLHARITDEDEDFGDLAREYSEDIGSAADGGRLGVVGRGEMVEPFEEALFALTSVGELSEPVRTQYGYHLIRLLDIEESEGPTAEDVRERVERELRLRQADDRFHNRADSMVDAAFENPSSLEPAARASGLDIRESDWFSRAQGEGVADAEAVRDAAFSEAVRDEGLNSDLIELEDGRILVLRLLDHRDPEPRAFDSVEDEVRDELRARGAAELLDEWSNELESMLAEGADVAALIDHDIPSQAQGPLRLSLSGDEWHEIGPDVRRTVFSMVPSANGLAQDTIQLFDGDRAIVVLHGVTYPDIASDDPDLDGIRSALTELYGGAEFDAWIAALREEASIEINRRLIER